MIGVHRSANTSAPSATGQYCPYPSTPLTILRDDPRAAVRISNFIPAAAAPMLLAMTTTQTAQEMWALGDYDRIAALIADLGTEVVAAAGIGPGMRVLDVGRRHRQRRTARRGRRRRRGGDRPHRRAAGGGGAARPRARPDAALGGGRRAGAAVRRRRVRRRAVEHRRDVRARPGRDGPRAAAGLPPRRNRGDGQLDAGWRRRPVLPSCWAATRQPATTTARRLLAWGDPGHVTALLAGRRRADRTPAPPPRLHRSGRRGGRVLPTALPARRRESWPASTTSGPTGWSASSPTCTPPKDTAPPGGPPCYELEYLLVRARLAE